MRKLVIAALAATAMGIVAPPAAAETAAGTVNVAGTVAAKCTALTPIGGSIVLNELSQADGRVDGAFSNATNKHLDFTVRCTGPNPTLSLGATPLVNTAASAGNGYTDTVHYWAQLRATRVSGTHTLVGSSPLDAFSSPIFGTLANTDGNIRITVSSGWTANATDLLTAGSYSGTITISVSPI